MSFATTELGESFAHALKIGEETQLHSAREKVLGLYAENRIGADEVRQAVVMAQNVRAWETVVLLAEAVMAYEDAGDVSPELYRRYAQALIERGALSGAECVLRRLIDDSPGDQVDEAGGLIGRIGKQRYIDFGNRAQLLRAIRSYANAYELPGADKVWLGGNLLAMLHRAERDGVPVPAGIPRSSQVRDDLSAILGSRDLLALNVWERATSVELNVATGDETAAVALAESLAKAERATPFEIAALRRQLSEVWELPDDHAIMVALAATVMDAGSGAVVDVPESGSLEKILSKELPLAYDSLVRGLEVARTVCMIVDAYDNALGTGFVIPGSELSGSWSDELVLVTNAHVIPDATPAARAKAKFTKMVGVGDGATPIIDELDLIWSSPVPELDASVLRFDGSLLPVVSEPIEISASVPDMRDADPFVYVVGHPAGRPLHLSIRGNELLDVNHHKLHYMAPTEPGSSGSPVFDKAWNLVGLHHAGSILMPRLDNPRDRYPANEAINIQAIRAALAAESTAAGFPRIEIVQPGGGESLESIRSKLDVDAELIQVEDPGDLEVLDPITVVSVLLTSAEIAQKVWNWWQGRQETGVQVKVVLADGTEIEFRDLDRDQLSDLVEKYSGR